MPFPRKKPFEDDPTTARPIEQTDEDDDELPAWAGDDSKDPPTFGPMLSSEYVKVIPLARDVQRMQNSEDMLGSAIDWLVLGGIDEAARTALVNEQSSEYGGPQQFERAVQRDSYPVQHFVTAREFEASKTSGAEYLSSHQPQSFNRYRNIFSTLDLSRRDGRAPSPEAVALDSDDDVELAKAIQRSLEDVQPYIISKSEPPSQQAMGGDSLHEAEEPASVSLTHHDKPELGETGAEDMIMTDACARYSTRNSDESTEQLSGVDTNEGFSDRDTLEIASCPEEDVALFRYFKQLPQQLRMTIWSYSYTGRLIEVLVKNGDFYARPLLANRIPTMVVCCESRAQALQDYPLCFSVDYKEPLIRFNFKYDTLLLGRGLLEGDNHHIFRRQCHKRDLDRVKSLMVDAELRWIGQDWFRHGQQHIRTGSGLCGLLRNVFPNVEEHTVIYTYSTDPVSWWAHASWFPHLPWNASHRLPNTNAKDVYRDIAESWSDWNNIRDAYSLLPEDIEVRRYGGVPLSVKWEPALKRWRIPSIFVWGLPKPMSYRDSNFTDLEEMIMDTVISQNFE